MREGKQPRTWKGQADSQFHALTKEKVWLWYGKGWAISDPYLINAMGRLDDDMELIWVTILPNFKLRKMYGKKT